MQSKADGVRLPGLEVQPLVDRLRPAGTEPVVRLPAQQVPRPSTTAEHVMLGSAQMLRSATCPVVSCPAVVLGERPLVVMQRPVQVRSAAAVLQVAAKRLVVSSPTSTVPALPAVTVSRVSGVVGLQRR